MIFYDMQKNYKFDDVDYENNTDWESIICSECDGHQRAGKRIGKLKIEITGKNKSDFFWTSLLSELIITDKVATIFKENNVTGYDLKEVEVCNMDYPFKLWEFVVIGNGGKAHIDSGIKLKYNCKSCGLKRYSAYENGIIVDEKNWDGSNFFTVEGYSKHILVTENIKELVKKHRLKGVNFIPSHELIWPEGVIKP